MAACAHIPLWNPVRRGPYNPPPEVVADWQGQSDVLQMVWTVLIGDGNAGLDETEAEARLSALAGALTAAAADPGLFPAHDGLCTQSLHRSRMTAIDLILRLLKTKAHGRRTPIQHPIWPANAIADYNLILGIAKPPDRPSRLTKQRETYFQVRDSFQEMLDDEIERRRTDSLSEQNTNVFELSETLRAMPEDLPVVAFDDGLFSERLSVAKSEIVRDGRPQDGLRTTVVISGGGAEAMSVRALLKVLWPFADFMPVRTKDDGYYPPLNQFVPAGGSYRGKTFDHSVLVL